MPELTIESVLDALKGVIDPDLNRDIVTLEFVKADYVQIDNGHVSFKVVLTTPACPVKEQLKAQCEELVLAIDGVESVTVKMDAVTVSKARGPDANRLPQVKNVIAVGSGKGGVGKSTVAANLAIALAQTGAEVGLLDADIYGPSVPIMLGLKGRPPQINAQQKIEPLVRYGLRTISMGFMLKDDDAVVWRGPMLGKALQQFIDDVEWPELDYLIIDLPPGTGDVQLSLSQLVPLDGAVVVTTPQAVAFADVRRAIRMFEMTKVPVLGMIENMSYFDCPDNGKRYYIFGEGRTESRANELGIPFLGCLPIDGQVAPASDRGEPIIVADPGGQQATCYKRIAGKVAAELSKRHLAQENKKDLKDFFKVSSAPRS
jgi:ATP-binding protein involved in chromosome partitioning